jgi:hypothetical protein
MSPTSCHPTAPWNSFSSSSLPRPTKRPQSRALRPAESCCWGRSHRHLERQQRTHAGRRLRRRRGPRAGRRRVGSDRKSAPIEGALNVVHARAGKQAISEVLVDGLRKRLSGVAPGFEGRVVAAGTLAQRVVAATFPDARSAPRSAPVVQPVEQVGQQDLPALIDARHRFERQPATAQHFGAVHGS